MKTTPHETTALEKVQSYTPEQLFGNDLAESILEEVRDAALSFVPDTTTAKGRKEIASLAAKVASTKVAVDKAGKSKVDPLKALAKVVDAERRKYKDGFQAIQDEVRSPLTEWEHEQNRIEEARKQTCFELEQCCIVTSTTTGDVLAVNRLDAQLEHLRSFNLENADLGAYAEKAEAIIQRGIVTVEAAIKTRKVLDQHAKDEATANAETPEQRAQREREIADNAAQAEREKVAAEAKRNADKAARRAADGKHVRQVKNEAYRSLMEVEGFDGASQMAIHVIQAIADGKIKHVSIKF